MVIEEVAKLSPIDRLIYWMQERHAIYLRRQAGQPKPWTNDEVMQRVFFTNPYREHDKTTVWFREHVREPMRNDPRVLFATVAFRWFNYIPTGEYLLHHGYLRDWNGPVVKGALHRFWLHGQQVFTGAYMIKAGNGPPGCKTEHVCDAITCVWQERDRLVDLCRNDCRLQALWEALKEFRGLGGFMAYEIVCDLRYTALLERATDVSTWANPGPGAMRGLLRLDGGVPEHNARGKTKRNIHVNHPVERMVELLAVARRRLRGMPTLEMREIEHSLCEFFKYERARLNDGRLKRMYNGLKD